MHKVICGTVALSALFAASFATHAQDVVRYKLPNSNFPIASAVEVPAGKATIYLSGKVPPVVDPKAAKDSAAAYGNTETQTIGVLTAIQKQLQGMHLDMGNIVKMNVFLVGDPDHGGHMDFEGFMAGYTKFFGTKDQPNLPARSAVQVAALANPGFRVEIEVTAVRP
jgi:enamine deaminase RidA (YjgF/YER057c/UK114 family)